MSGLWFTKRRDFGIVDSVPPQASKTFIAAYSENLVKSGRAIYPVKLLVFIFLFKHVAPRIVGIQNITAFVRCDINMFAMTQSCQYTQFQWSLKLQRHKLLFLVGRNFRSRSKLHCMSSLHVWYVEEEILKFDILSYPGPVSTELWTPLHAGSSNTELDKFV